MESCGRLMLVVKLTGLYHQLKSTQHWAGLCFSDAPELASVYRNVLPVLPGQAGGPIPSVGATTRLSILFRAAYIIVGSDIDTAHEFPISNTSSFVLDSKEIYGDESLIKQMLSHSNLSSFSYCPR